MKIKLERNKMTLEVTNDSTKVIVSDHKNSSNFDIRS